MPASTEPLLPDKQTNDLFVKGIEHFNDAMDMRTEMNIRVAKRVTALVRGIMVSLGILLMGGFYLLIVLKSHLGDLTLTVQTMNNHMSVMTRDMKDMRYYVSDMQKDMESMQIIVTQVQNMQMDVAKISSSVGKLSGSMLLINQDMVSITQDINGMTTNFHYMEQSVHQINRDVDTMASPMRSWNAFSPFP